MGYQLVKLSELAEMDEEYYPRVKMDWLTIHQYTRAMEAGAEFPPITIAKLRGRWHILDGWHRIEAYKTQGTKTVRAEVVKVKDKREFFAEAVRRNTTHGHPLSVQERARALHRLIEWNIEPAEIVKITNIPMEDWGRMEAKTILGPGDQIVTLKGPIERMVGPEIDLATLERNQAPLTARNQVQLFKQAAYLLENNLADLNDKRVAEYLTRIYRVLEEKIQKIGA